MIELLLTLGGPQAKIIRGQKTWTVPGTYTFTVPDEVTRICVLLISAGAAGYIRYDYANGGSGGGVRWYNNYAVKPGDKITVVVGDPGVRQDSSSDILGNENSPSLRSSAINIWVGPYKAGSSDPINSGGSATMAPPNIGGGYGGLQSFSAADKDTNYGGSVAYLTGTGDSGSTVYAGNGLDPVTSSAVQRNGFYAASAGGGGTAITKAASRTTNMSFPGGAGAVRIIWGPNRWFPHKNTQDMY